jgi:hypothetical protein
MLVIQMPDSPEYRKKKRARKRRLYGYIVADLILIYAGTAAMVTGADFPRQMAWVLGFAWLAWCIHTEV